MTETLAIPSDMKLIHIHTMDGTIELHGRKLGVVDNERRGRPRWAEIELYRYIDTDISHVVNVKGADGETLIDPDTNEPVINEEATTYGKVIYLLHTMGHSVVYHRHDGDCNRGIAVPVDEFEDRAEFPEDLEPCEDCSPIDWRDVPAETIYDLEVLRHLIYPCKNPEAVLERLRRPSKVTCPQCHGDRSYPQSTRAVCQKCHGRGYVSGAQQLSAPGMRLVEMVKWKDDAIRQAAQRTVRL